MPRKINYVVPKNLLARMILTLLLEGYTENITSTKELENWIRDPESARSKKLNLDRMALFDNNENPSTNEFPDSISLNSNQIPINYIFQPGRKRMERQFKFLSSLLISSGRGY